MAPHGFDSGAESSLTRLQPPFSRRACPACVETNQTRRNLQIIRF
jgi:hypothetical protein